MTAAREFLEDPGDLSGDRNLDLMNDTITYLLKNAAGLENVKSRDTIIGFLHDREHTINRDRWETAVLGKLKEEGVFIASQDPDRLYIVKTREEAEHFIYNTYRSMSDHA